MVLIALSFQGQVEKYGVYIGVAAFFGLAVLSLLYFSQARELKRLREWAGRAPERARELEERVVAEAEAAAAAARPAAQAKAGIAPPRRPGEMPAAPLGGQTAAGAQSTELAEAVEDDQDAAAATNGNAPGAPAAPAAEGPDTGNGAAPPAEGEIPAAAEAEAEADGEEPAADAPAEGDASAAVAAGEASEGPAGAAGLQAEAPADAAGPQTEGPAGAAGLQAEAPADAAGPQAEGPADADADAVSETTALAEEASATAASGAAPTPAASAGAAATGAPPMPATPAAAAAAGTAPTPATPAAEGTGDDAGGEASATPSEAEREPAVRDAGDERERTVADRPGAVSAPVPRITPAQRVGVTPRPAPMPLRQSQPTATPAGRAAPGRPAGQPARRPAAAPRPGRSAGTIALFVGIAVLILGGGTFAVSQLAGDDSPTPPNRAAPAPGESGTGTDGSSGSATTPAETNVAVLNGTTFTGLAGQLADRISQEGGYERGATETNTRDQTLQASTVYYANGFRPQARKVAGLLSITAVEPLDDDTQSLAPEADVVVLAGADQAP